MATRHAASEVAQMSQSSGDAPAGVIGVSSAASVSVGAGEPRSAPRHPVTSTGAAARGGGTGLPPDFVLEESSVAELMRRVARMERRIRVQLYALILVGVAGLGVLVDKLLIEEVIVRQRLMESRELTLVDNAGNARLFVRMYSKVPVLQIMDSNGKPRMSLGLRFDDTPFVDLSDRTGRTRATFEMTEHDTPALRMFDQNGNPTFTIN
jgi:hypothetical protein